MSEETQTEQIAPKVNLVLDLNEINYLITILSEKPIKEAILLWDKIRVQAINQVQAQTPAE